MSILRKARRGLTELKIGGLARMSGCDWPDRLVATIFCQGCGWRCPYCHNRHLLPMDSRHGIIPWADVRAFLDSRRGLLDGVVFSGGEPTLQDGLLDAIRETRAMGFSIGLHTGGPHPERFAALLPLLDWVGLDIKAPFDEYERITGSPGSGACARESLALLLDSGVAFELRTTVHPALLDDVALTRLHADLAEFGLPGPKIQPYRPPPMTAAANG